MCIEMENVDTADLLIWTGYAWLRPVVHSVLNSSKYSPGMLSTSVVVENLCFNTDERH